jgi:hypothetical protein
MSFEEDLFKETRPTLFPNPNQIGFIRKHSPWNTLESFNC